MPSPDCDTRAVPIAYAVCFFEFFGGIGLTLGLLTRASALAVIIVMVGAIAKVHWPSGFFIKGKLGGSGKVVILPVDQGFEHGPARSFAPNPPAYDPHYHWQLAIEAGLSAFAAPLGFIEGGASTYAGQVPTILKVNGANSLARAKEAADNAVTASVKDALRLGCCAVVDAFEPRHGGLAALADAQDAPLGASNEQRLVGGEAFDAVAEQLEPHLALDPMRTRNRSESDAALTAIFGRHGQALVSSA